MDKRAETFPPSPLFIRILADLAAKADWVRLTADRVRRDVDTDKILAAVFQALEAGKLSMVDLHQLLIDIVRVPAQMGVPEDLLILDDGYWRRLSNIVARGYCRCGQAACTGEASTIYCYFHDELPAWVIAEGLYHRCYDEVVPCPRCPRTHKRGHIGRLGFCGNPYVDQAARQD